MFKFFKPVRATFPYLMLWLHGEEAIALVPDDQDLDHSYVFQGSREETVTYFFGYTKKGHNLHITRSP